MPTSLIDGRTTAARLTEQTRSEVAVLAAAGTVPGLAVVLVGADPASEVYVRNKIRQTVLAGIRSFEHRLANDISQTMLLELISRLNSDTAVHGILVQLPLPEHINTSLILSAVDPAKDVDGFHVVNAGRLAVGLPGLVPCTPLGCLLLLKEAVGDLTGMNAMVVGRSTIVGKPMAQLLLAENCTVTLAHSHTRNLPDLCRQADLLVAATGRPEMVRAKWIKPGAAVIDVGINRVMREGKTRLVGDVAFDEANGIAGWITPVPGGVGPMTVAMLLRNTLQAARMQTG